MKTKDLFIAMISAFLIVGCSTKEEQVVEEEEEKYEVDDYEEDGVKPLDVKTVSIESELSEEVKSMVNQAREYAQNNLINDELTLTSVYLGHSYSDTYVFGFLTSYNTGIMVAYNTYDKEYVGTKVTYDYDNVYGCTFYGSGRCKKVDEIEDYYFQSAGEFNAALQYPICDDGDEFEDFYFYTLFEKEEADWELYDANLNNQ